MPELTSEEARWLSGLAQFDTGNRLALMAIFAGFGVPASYLDVGCGTGAMVKLAKHLGVNAMGVDILPHDEPFLRQHDLREPLALGRTFDLITCIEVPEHVAPEASDNLCDILANHLAGDGINSSGLLVFTSAPPGQNGDGHINCVIGETEVWSELGIRAATRRWYNGQTVTVVTRGNNELTVTPNHPVLTDRGWMPARLLQVGDNVFRRVEAQGKPFCVVPNDDQSPTMIKEVFGAFAELQHARRLSVPLTAKDFHGDVTDGEVEIIYPDCLAELGTDAQLLQPFRKFPVEWRYALTGLLESFGAEGFRLDSVTMPPAFAVGGTCEISPVSVREGRHSHEHNLTRGSNGDPIAFQDVGDSRSGAMQFTPNGFSRATGQVLTDNPLNVERRFEGRAMVANGDPGRAKYPARGSGVNVSFADQRVHGFPAGIASDEVVKVKCSNFRGHVFNLSTENEWYFANSIITHNCQTKQYWREKLEARKLKFSLSATTRLVMLWEQTHWATHWCEQNLQVFTR